MIKKHPAFKKNTFLKISKQFFKPRLQLIGGTLKEVKKMNSIHLKTVIFAVLSYSVTSQAICKESFSNNNSANEKLLLATQKGDLKEVYLAIQQGATNINQALIETGKKEDSSFFKYMSLSYKRVKIAKYLIDHKEADINFQDDKGRTVLMYALARTGERDFWLSEYLLSKNADIDIQDKEGKTALMYYVTDITKKNVNARGLFRLLDETNKKFKVNLKDNEGKTLLMYAVKFDYRGDWIVSHLISKGADTKAQDNNGKTVTEYAIERGVKKFIDLVL